MVGLQLDPKDAAAVLQGDQARAVACLLPQLSVAQAWPAAIQRGVELLAWMVANGYLELRVGLRVHGKQGTPRPPDYAQDGYLHEKWAIFSDDQEALFISGSLNESLTALALNAENITVQPSWIDWNRKLFRHKRASFEALWAGNHAYIRTLTLPDAVKERLVTIADNAGPLQEIDGTPMEQGRRRKAREVAETTDGALTPTFNERLRAAMIRLAPLLPGDERVELGLRELISGKGKLFDAPLEIISTGLIINRRGGRLLAQFPRTDLVLVDEAHKARRQSPDNNAQMPRFNKLYQELRDILYGQSGTLLLATATPMQLNRVEAFDLLKLMPSASAVQFSEDLCELFYRVRERLLQGDALREYEQRWLQRLRAAHAHPCTPPLRDRCTDDGSPARLLPVRRPATEFHQGHLHRRRAGPVAAELERRDRALDRVGTT